MTRNNVTRGLRSDMERASKGILSRCCCSGFEMVLSLYVGQDLAMKPDDLNLGNPPIFWSTQK